MDFLENLSDRLGLEIYLKRDDLTDLALTLRFPALNKGKSGGGVVTNNAADAILSDDPYPIKMAIGYWNNFTFSCTGAERWEKALVKLPFLLLL